MDRKIDCVISPQVEIMQRAIESESPSPDITTSQPTRNLFRCRIPSVGQRLERMIRNNARVIIKMKHTSKAVFVG
ncbi:MAG TPA: hypothetical protein DDZ51_18410 [Planctomycetaceae bacterium]|nr:hypothetical protein [Planctomycetaceae bacterium]